jgi:hypothetical protein
VIGNVRNSSGELQMVEENIDEKESVRAFGRRGFNQPDASRSLRMTLT